MVLEDMYAHCETHLEFLDGPFSAKELVISFRIMKTGAKNNWNQ